MFEKHKRQPATPPSPMSETFVGLHLSTQCRHTATTLPPPPSRAPTAGEEARGVGQAEAGAEVGRGGAAVPLLEVTGTPPAVVAVVLRGSTGRTSTMMTMTGRLCASCARTRSSSSRWGSATTPEGEWFTRVGQAGRCKVLLISELDVVVGVTNMSAFACRLRRTMSLHACRPKITRGAPVRIGSVPGRPVHFPLSRIPLSQRVFSRSVSTSSTARCAFRGEHQKAQTSMHCMRSPFRKLGKLGFWTILKLDLCRTSGAQRVQ